MSTGVFHPPSLEPEADLEAPIEEEEYLSEGLLKSPAPPAADSQQQPHQQQKQQPAPDTDEAALSARRALSARLSGIGAPHLPASCRVKRLGSAPALGISGSASVRGPLDRLAHEVARRRLATHGGAPPLPVTRLDVYQHGLGIAEDAAFFPIETVSYASMDTRMPRVFCFVSVEIAAGGSAPVNPACHAFLCASAEACYRLVLAVTAAFNSAINRSKAVRRRPPAAASSVARTSASATAAATAADSKPVARRVVNLAFTGDHEDA